MTSPHPIKTVTEFLRETAHRDRSEITLANFERFLSSLSVAGGDSPPGRLCVYAYRVNPHNLQLYVGISSCLRRREEQHRRKRIRRYARMVLILMADTQNPFEDEDAVVNRLRKLIGREYVTGGRHAVHPDRAENDRTYDQRIRRNLCVSCGNPGHYIAECENYTPCTQAQLKSDALGAGQRLYIVNAHALYNFAASTFEKIVVELARFCAAVERHAVQDESGGVPSEVADLANLAHAAKRAGVDFARSCESFPGAWLHLLSLPDGKPDSAPEHHSCAAREAAAGAAVVEMRAQGRAQYNKGAELANYIVAVVTTNACVPLLEGGEWIALRSFSEGAQKRRLGQPNGPRTRVPLSMVT